MHGGVAIKTVSGNSESRVLTPLRGDEYRIHEYVVFSRRRHVNNVSARRESNFSDVAYATVRRNSIVRDYMPVSCACLLVREIS